MHLLSSSLPALDVNKTAGIIDSGIIKTIELPGGTRPTLQQNEEGLWLVSTLSKNLLLGSEAVVKWHNNIVFLQVSVTEKRWGRTEDWHKINWLITQLQIGLETFPIRFSYQFYHSSLLQYTHDVLGYIYLKLFDIIIAHSRGKRVN